VPVGANGDGWGRKRVEACEVGDADRRGTRQGGSTRGCGGGCVGDLKNHRVAGDGGVFPVAGEGHGRGARLWADCFPCSVRRAVGRSWPQPNSNSRVPRPTRIVDFFFFMYVLQKSRTVDYEALRFVPTQYSHRETGFGFSRYQISGSEIIETH
jgi:hypothetical protein